MKEVITTVSDQDALKFMDMALNAGHYRRHKREASRLAENLGKEEKYRNHFETAEMNGLSVLNFTVKEGHVLIAKLLMAKLGVNPNTTQYDKTDRTTLHYAAQGGWLELVKELMANYNSDAGARDKCGSTPLHLAIFNDHSDTAVEIIERGANVEIQNHFGMAMHVAAFTGCQSVIAAIAKKFPNQVNAQISGFVTPLVCAIFGDERDCEEFLQQRVSLEGKALLYKVVSFKTVEAEAFESVSALLQRGADPNLCEEVLYEDLAIICAAKKGWPSVVLPLLEKTHRIPGVINWNYTGLVDYVKTEDFKQRDAEKVATRVIQLKSKILDELKMENCMAAYIICMSLKNDMNSVEWDRWNSLCHFLTFMLFQACTVKCDPKSIHSWVVTFSAALEKNPANLQWCIMGLKACLALSPDNLEYMNMYNALTRASGN